MHRPGTRALLAVALAGFVVTLAVFAADYGRVPAIVPTHFGPSGAPDAFGPKSTFVIFPAVGLLMMLLAAVVSTVGLPAKRRPVPASLPLLVGVVFVEMVWVMAVTEIGAFRVALGAAPGLDPSVMFACLGVVMATAVVILAVSLRSACCCLLL